jgi:hypothetical protein
MAVINRTNLTEKNSYQVKNRNYLVRDKVFGYFCKFKTKKITIINQLKPTP